MQGWRARKGVLASRGEVEGPRVAEADAALAFWAVHKRLTAAVEAGTMPAENVENVEKVLDQLAEVPPRS
ncbi:hypothetical protein SAMN05445060_2276 [Williamsia sterculiae]|uniref:Uncharacterized protein n=1 Tax=Williamsia sterculiae TaxID=1344003 RepID=A0A1N7FTL9_9NOCA|nr:hypothetical protein SAMN05445060_2276 [Williamsia sterculiae]